MNAINDFGSCQLSELDYILKKQTKRTSESGSYSPDKPEM